jgi:putative hydrolase of the HAD superfamily
MRKKEYSVICFDADDTLWINEVYYQQTEQLFYMLLKEFCSEKECAEELYRTEMKNLKIYGYGTKGFMLSMIETALRISHNKVSQSDITKIIKAGKDMLNKPIVLLDGVKKTLEKISGKEYTLIVATKGDLIDQERKLKASGIAHCFDHIEIMSNKAETDYKKLLSQLQIQADQFLMVGNSLKSDILPVLNIGGNAIHIPFHTTWQHELSSSDSIKKTYQTLDTISELSNYLNV